MLLHTYLNSFSVKLVVEISFKVLLKLVLLRFFKKMEEKAKLKEIIVSTVKVGPSLLVQPKLNHLVSDIK